MKRFHLHLVSDATGETINSVARAAISQFEDIEVTEHFWSLVRGKRQIDGVLAALGYSYRHLGGLRAFNAVPGAAPEFVRSQGFGNLFNKVSPKPDTSLIQASHKPDTSFIQA